MRALFAAERNHATGVFAVLINRRITFAALVYLIAGLVSAAMAARATSHQAVLAWRLAAWCVSALTFGVHIFYEVVRLRVLPQVTAYRAGLAAALAALGLAVAANIRNMTTSDARPSTIMLLSLAIWPVMTMLPAFLVGLLAATALRRVTAKRDV